MNSHRNSIILLRCVFLTFYFLSLPAIKLLILEFAYWLNVKKIYAQDWFILQLISQTTTFFFFNYYGVMYKPKINYFWVSLV